MVQLHARPTSLSSPGPHGLGVVDQPSWHSNGHPLHKGTYSICTPRQTLNVVTKPCWRVGDRYRSFSFDSMVMAVAASHVRSAALILLQFHICS